MPVGCHRFDDTADDEFTAFIATRRKQYVEVAFAIFTSFELVENAILEGTEALGATGEMSDNSVNGLSDWNY